MCTANIYCIVSYNGMFSKICEVSHSIEGSTFTVVVLLWTFLPSIVDFNDDDDGGGGDSAAFVMEHSSTFSPSRSFSLLNAFFLILCWWQ